MEARPSSRRRLIPDWPPARFTRLRGGLSGAYMDTMQRFWAKVDRRGPDECWPWKGATTHGYGYMKVRRDGKRIAIGAHRIALAGFPLVFPKMFACHHCDNPLCCNPRHLYFGTNETNVADRTERNRHPRVKPKGLASKARELFASGMSKREIARQLGMHERSVRTAVAQVNPRPYTVKSPSSPPAPPLAPP